MNDGSKGRYSIGATLLLCLSLAILSAYFVELFFSKPQAPPTAEERAEAYRKEYESGMRSCRYDYPDEEQLMRELWQNYEECARARAAVGMRNWEAYR